MVNFLSVVHIFFSAAVNEVYVLVLTSEAKFFFFCICVCFSDSLHRWLKFFFSRDSIVDVWSTCFLVVVFYWRFGS